MHLTGGSECSSEVTDNVEHTSGTVCADVIGALHTLLERDEICARYITHMDVVALLSAVAMNDRRLPGKKLFKENGYHTRLAMGILAWTVDVGVAERGDAHMVC